MMLLIQIDFSSAQFNILHWGLSAYRKSLSDGMTVESGGSVKWNRCLKVFVLAELVQFVIKCLILFPFPYKSIGDMGHIWHYDLVRSCLIICKYISYFPKLGKNTIYIFSNMRQNMRWEGYIGGEKFITFIIFALKDSDFVGASVPYWLKSRLGNL